jgi:LasA protease
MIGSTAHSQGLDAGASVRRSRLLLAAVVLLLSASIMTLSSPALAAPTLAESHIGLPWKVGETARFVAGPHHNLHHDCAKEPPACNSLDFVPTSKIVRAAQAGVVHFPYCGPRHKLVVIDHGGGWFTGYYHMAAPVVKEGQPVHAGDELGKIGENLSCGGEASGPHVHFFVKYVPGCKAATPQSGDCYKKLGDPFKHTTVDVALDGGELGGWHIQGKLGSSCMTHISPADKRCEGKQVMNYGSSSNELLAIGVCGAAGEGSAPAPGGICTLRPDGSQRRQVTNGVDSEPAWSPDGTRIAFARSDSQGASQIEVVNADGSGIAALTNGQNDGAPAWAPRGDKIAFAHSGEIAVLDLMTGKLTFLTAGPRDYDPSWSADGSLIAFASGTAPAQIDVVTPTGGHRHSLVVGIQPAWAPSGNTLAFTRVTSLGSHIMVTNGTTGRPVHELTAGQADSYAPAWSPNGKRIAFGRGQNMENPAVWVMNADGSHQTRLFGGYDPAW